ncbi:MAG: hypothetical protein ABXS93_01855 [Sulfurimonas sp.]
MLSSITIKRNNHWLYHSEPSRKQEMLTQLISHYADKSILIAVSQQDNLSLEEAENITVMTDDEIMVADAQQFDLIIHADLPVKALHYIKRLSCAKELSIGLLLAEESQLLYQIETLLGRTIPQKYLEGFEPVKTLNSSQRDQKPRGDKRRQRNHHKDGTVRTEEERAEYQSRRAQSGKKHKPFGNKKKYDKKERSDNKFAQPKRKPRTIKIKTSKKVR